MNSYAHFSVIFTEPFLGGQENKKENLPLQQKTEQRRKTLQKYKKNNNNNIMATAVQQAFYLATAVTASSANCPVTLLSTLFVTCLCPDWSTNKTNSIKSWRRFLCSPKLIIKLVFIQSSFLIRKPADLHNLAPGTNPPFLTFKEEVLTDVNKIEEYLEQMLAPPK